MHALSALAIQSLYRWKNAGSRTEIDPVLRSRGRFAILFLIGFCLCLLLLPSSHSVTKIVSNIGQLAGVIVGAMWAFRAARSTSSHTGEKLSLRWVPLCLGLGITSYAVGQLIWTYDEFILKRDTPFPSWADAGFVAEYPFMLAGILLLPGRRLTAALRSRIVLESLITITGAFTFSWYYVIGPTVAQAPAGTLAKVLGIGYPLCDLLLLSCVFVTASLHGRASGVNYVRPLVTGILIIVATDAVFAYQTMHETYATGSLVDLGWPAGYLSIGYAALGYSRRWVHGDVRAERDGPGADREVSLWRLVSPFVLFPAVGILLLLSETSRSDGHSVLGVRIGAALLLGLVLARQLVISLENHRLWGRLDLINDELANKSDILAALEVKDGMTGLANHRTFHERLRAEIRDTASTRRSLAVVMVDVDQFKHLNDTFGHTTGDEVLKVVARLLQQCVRGEDLVARYGGEEFAILLPNADAECACTVAERIRSTIASYPFAFGCVTVSIGVAPVPSSSLEPEALVKRADHALYTAKHKGRNRVVIAEEIDSDLDSSARGRTGLNLRVISVCEAEVCKTVRPASQSAADSADRTPGGQILSAMLALLDLRDSETEGHSQRVARFALRLADEIERRGIAPVTERVRRELALGALLHDVGKIGVPDSILKKPATLTDHEWEVMRRHPNQGASLLARFPIMSDALPVVRHHHERWDGTGYPDRLGGDEIPLSARIFALADTFDAMSSDRVYRKALPFEAIKTEFDRVSGTQFDPDLVAAFQAISEDDWMSLRREALGGADDWRLRDVSELPEAA